jgi:hypothetical protein
MRGPPERARVLSRYPRAALCARARVRPIAARCVLRRTHRVLHGAGGREAAAYTHRAGARGHSDSTTRVLECAAAAARPEGPRRAVRSCAGAYVPGAKGSNECPAGSARIEDEAACRAAAAAAGLTFSGAETNSYCPRGCYYTSTNNRAYLNDHSVGAGISQAQLLCPTTTGAPVTPLTVACVP